MTATELSPAPTELAAPDYIARAREVAKAIEAEANNIEEAATITRPVYEALADAGLFWVLIPGAYGGGGTDIVTAFKVIQEISRADGSTGWAFMANICSAAVAAGFMNSEGGQEMFGGENKAITAGMVVPTGKATRVDGGYRVDSRYQFASGSAHASWIGAGFVVVDDNGEPVLVDGEPQCRIAFLPRDEVEFLGNWDVMGMVGTGSYDYAVKDRFVPDKFTMETFATVPTQAEPVYQLGLLGIGVGGHAPVALGLAQRALQEIAGIVNNKIRPGYDGPVGDSDLFQLDFMRHEAKFRAAQAYVYEVFGDAEATAAQGNEISDEQRARMRQATTWVQEVTGEVVMFAHRWAGSATVRNPSALGRCVRDAAVATQHVLIDRMTLVEAAPAILPGYQNR